MKIPKMLYCCALSLIMLSGLQLAGKPRLIVTTDIGGDPGDQQSLIRLLVYSDAFEIEALIASAAGTPNELKEEITRPDLIQEIVLAYQEVFPKLRAYNPDYPSPEVLLSRIYSGNPQRGWEQVGVGKDTPGSQALQEAILKNDDRPLNVAIWGGQTDFAQALWKLKNTLPQADYENALRRVRVHDIADQDGIFGQILLEHNMFQKGPLYILNRAPEGADKREAVFRGMYLGGNEPLTSREWIDAHVRTHHGPLGALYPIKTWTAPNPHGVLKEGDTPSWFYFLETGLQHPDEPMWGGWGGRFQAFPNHNSRYFIDATDTVDGTTSARATVWRWRQDFQNAFAARMDACVIGGEANRAPVVKLSDSAEAFPVFELKRGQHGILDFRESSDPDGDLLSAEAFLYPEAGTPGVQLSIESLDGLRFRYVVPKASPEGTAHIIVRVFDNGTPSLSSYKRIRIHITPVH